MDFSGSVLSSGQTIQMEAKQERNWHDPISSASVEIVHCGLQCLIEEALDVAMRQQLITQSRA